MSSPHAVLTLVIFLGPLHLSSAPFHFRPAGLETDDDLGIVLPCDVSLGDTLRSHTPPSGSNRSSLIQSDTSSTICRNNTGSTICRNNTDTTLVGAESPDPLRHDLEENKGTGDE